MTPRALTAALIAAVATLVCAPASWAGSFVVQSCGYRPAGGADNAWQFVTNAPAFVTTAPNGCATAGQNENAGLVIREVWGSPPLPPGTRGEWRMTAPGGTTISQVQLWRYLQQWDGSEWRLYGRAADGSFIESAQPFIGSANIGAWSGGGNVTFSGLATGSVAWGLDCNAVDCLVNTGAYGSYKLHAAIYRSQVTVTDNTSPSGGDVSGQVTAGGWLTGTSVAAQLQPGTDSTGVKHARLRVDGTALAGHDYACDFSRATNQGGVMVIDPCPHPTDPLPVSVPISGLGEGEHTVRAETIDAAANTALGPARTFRVDNTPPPAPSVITTDLSTTTSTAQVRWQPASAGQGSAVASVRYQLCTPGGSCGAAQSLDASATSADVTVPGHGSYEVRVWAVDAAGNSSQASPSSAWITYSAPPAADPGTGGGLPAPPPTSPPVTSGPTTTTQPGTSGGQQTGSRQTSSTTRQPATTKSTKTQTPAGTDDADEAQTALADPGLRLLSARRTRGAIVVAGRLTTRPGRATVTVTVRQGERARSYRRTITRGQWRVNVPAPTRSGRATVTVAIGKGRGYRAARTTRIVR